MYARLLRKCSLAKFLMNLWLVVIMLLVICCQNASTMHLVKNARAAASTANSASMNPAMTMYSPYDSNYQGRGSPWTRFAPRSQDMTPRLDNVQQLHQLRSPYTVFIRTKPDTAKISYNVPNINSQIINLNSNSHDSRSLLDGSYSINASASNEELKLVSRSQSVHRVDNFEPSVAQGRPKLGYASNSGRYASRFLRRKQLTLHSQERSFAGSRIIPQSSQLQPSQPSLPQQLLYDPFRPQPNWLHEQLERQERIDRHRQRRHRNEEQASRLNEQQPVSGRQWLDSNANGRADQSSPFSTITTTFSKTNVDNSKDNTKDSPSSKSSTFPQLSGSDSQEKKLISSSNNGNHTGSYRRPRISRSHHPRRRPKRYCSARDPVQLAYLAPIVLEGKVRSMSPYRRANFSVSFQITQIFKNRQKHNIGKFDLVRLQFTFLNTSGECDIYQEKFRERGLIKRDLQNGRNYTLFLKYAGEKFVILGQPILSNLRVYNYVKNASQDKFGKAASIKELKANRQNKVPEKEELRIVCRVRGNPPPKITWFKDDKSIKQSRQLYQFINLKRRSELIVKSFSNATAGLYECRAKNMFSKRIEKKTIRIEAYGRPESHNDTGEDCDASMIAYCLNGGICRFVSDISHYYCKCAEGFEGDRCQEKRPTNVSLNQTVTGYMADSPTDTMSEESDENLSLSEE